MTYAAMTTEPRPGRGSDSKGWLAFTWWRDLHPDEKGHGGDRGALARLRRAATPSDVLAEPDAISLYGRLAGRPYDRRTAENVAILAGVLPAIRFNPQSGRLQFAQALGLRSDGGWPEKGDRRTMSPLRFGALMRARSPEERMRQLRTALALLGDRPFDIARFADDVWRWSESIRQHWIFEYYQRGRDAPDAKKPAPADPKEPAAGGEEDVP
ncbi:MAG: type I-E CRISPR-associated protein Cse2/CasB [Gammaproteobacteria bacterium]